MRNLILVIVRYLKIKNMNALFKFSKKEIMIKMLIANLMARTTKREIVMTLPMMIEKMILLNSILKTAYSEVKLICLILHNINSQIFTKLNKKSQ